MQGVTGTLALARGEPGWEERLDLTPSGVFASFLAVPLSVPAVILSGEVGRQLRVGAAADAALPGPVVTAVAGLVGMALAWGAALFILARFAGKTGEGWRVSPLVIGYNWSRLIANLAGGLAAAIGLLTGQVSLLGAFGLLALVLAVWLDYGVVKRSLALPLGPTVGILMMLFLARVLALLLVSALATPFMPTPAGA